MPFILQVARTPNLASRQYRPRNHGRHLNFVRACLHRHGADRGQRAGQSMYSAPPPKIASPAARTVGQSNTVHRIIGLFDTVKYPANRVLELEFQNLSNISIRLQTLSKMDNSPEIQVLAQSIRLVIDSFSPNRLEAIRGHPETN
jgi:hypothetical protein